MEQTYKTKKHRLTPDNYIGEKLYFITIDTFQKREYFKDKNIIYKVKEIMDKTITIYKIKNLLTVFMFDHVHHIFKGLFEDSDLKRCIKVYKSLVGIEYKNMFNSKFWHKDYYDHIIRNEKMLPKIIRYTLENPVRKSYIDNYMNWQFSFSDEYNLEDFRDVYYNNILDLSLL